MFLFILDRVIAVFEKLIRLVFILSVTALIIYFTLSSLQEKVSKIPLKLVLNGFALLGNSGVYRDDVPSGTRSKLVFIIGYYYDILSL